MNYTLCDETSLGYELAKATAKAKEGGVSLAMVKAALPQFDDNDVVRVRGALYSENGARCESVAEVILIRYEELVVGEVSVLTRKEAISSPDVPKMCLVYAMWPNLVAHIREIAFHLSPRRVSHVGVATQLLSDEDEVRLKRRLDELRHNIEDRRRRAASIVAPTDNFMLTRDGQSSTPHSDDADRALPQREEGEQTMRVQTRLEELRWDIRVRKDVIRAFHAGFVRDYVAAVAGAGAMVAAETLTTYLCNSRVGQEALRTTSAHLINPAILDQVPGANDFMARMYLKLTDPTLETTEDGKALLIRALLPFTETEDLGKIQPLSFTEPEARLMAAGVPVLPRPLEWAEAAIAFEDEVLFELVRPQLLEDDLFALWKEVAGRTTSEVAFLIGQKVPPVLVAQKHCIFDLLPSIGQNQSEIAALLAAAWPDEAATYQIKPPSEPRTYWHGQTLKNLVEASATMDRENWLEIFGWDSLEVWSNQITGLKGIPRSLHDWNGLSVSKTVFLEEILCRLSPDEKESRRCVLEGLLTSGADPRPILVSSQQMNLSLSEKQLLQDVAQGWSVTKAPSQPMTTEIELA